MHVIDVMAMAMEQMDIVIFDEGDNDLLAVMAMVMEVMDIVIGLKL